MEKLINMFLALIVIGSTYTVVNSLNTLNSAMNHNAPIASQVSLARN